MFGRQLFKRCLVSGFCIAMLSITGLSQDITSGTIQGVISDEQGAVVPGATVEARNIGTNFTRSFTTDEDGRFTLLSLPPGRYVVSVTKTGFAKLNQENVEITVGRQLALNLTLRVSGVSGEVTITSTPTIDTAKTEASTTLNEKTIENTPILGRKFEDLLTLTPGVSITQGPDGDEINFAGQRGIFNNVSLDGGDYNNGFFGEQAGGQRAAIDIALEAIKEFQVIATGAGAEYGRTAGGIINVITKSGTNDVHGSLFANFRHEKLSSETSDGRPLDGFHREQFGGTIGGPIVRNKAFYFLALESIRENLTRGNLSEQVGATACPVAAPTILANEGAIVANPDCQRLALLNFFRTTRTQEEGTPIDRAVRNTALLGKIDWDVNDSNKLSASYNFDYSKNTNQTFDVPTYGVSANGTEGPSKINVANFNWYTTFSPTLVNEAHFTYAREERPRSAIQSNIPADTAMGFGTTFRFGNPFFLQPGVDELFWRTQVRDHVSLIKGAHNIKFGGEWMHSLNDQVFRGFFTGRYIFDSVNGFLRYASAPATNGFGPSAVLCSGGTWITPAAPFNQACPVGQTSSTPLLLYLQGAGRTAPATDAAGASKITNEDYALFAQDKWQIWQNFTLNFGLRWEAQIFPDPVVEPSQTAYGIFLSDPRFPSDGTLPSDKSMWQPRIGFAWDVASNGKSVVRGSFGVYNARQNMLSQVGSITTNGVQQQTIAAGPFNNLRPVWPNVLPVTAQTCTGGLGTTQFPCFSGVRVFDRNYENPDIYTFNAAFEQEIAPNWALYFDFTHSKAVHLTRFLNVNRNGFFFPYLDETMVASSVGRSRYMGFTAGIRKRFSDRFQLEANYVFSKDKDDDSNERDPFTDRSFNINNLRLDYALSDRDIRHKFNFFSHFELPWGFEFTPRVQIRSAQPATPLPRTATNRNTLRKDNKYFSFDWRLAKVFKLTETVELTPQIEMFNTFNNDNFVNSLSGAGNQNSLTAPSLFNFDGFLRQGIGDPRQVQLSVRLRF
ncbi:MAG TPA: carboxypeptidase regulatory-like domain-containing protein [Pyrinomonadaceae bacterium]|nr:carboxypeptidase regulatory-like domain-containing protein [Pyrinomonadaceae bacterium]